MGHRRWKVALLTGILPAMHCEGGGEGFLYLGTEGQIGDGEMEAPQRDCGRWVQQVGFDHCLKGHKVTVPPSAAILEIQELAASSNRSPPHQGPLHLSCHQNTLQTKRVGGLSQLYYFARLTFFAGTFPSDRYMHEACYSINTVLNLPAYF